METITIRIKDGMITQVEDIQDNIMIKVIDYDTNGGSGPAINKDKYGKDCFVYTYDINDCRKENI